MLKETEWTIGFVSSFLSLEAFQVGEVEDQGLPGYAYILMITVQFALISTIKFITKLKI